jgi:hypothetical protein
MASRINKAWHEGHVMPNNANIQQRIEWHLAHHEHCNCRPIPASVMLALSERSGGDGSTIPAQSAGSSAKKAKMSAAGESSKKRTRR